jgi:hypothetical protein
LHAIFEMRHHHCVAQLHLDDEEPITHTQPSVLPASVVIVHTPLQGLMHAAPLATPDAHAGGVVEAGW